MPSDRPPGVFSRVPQSRDQNMISDSIHANAGVPLILAEGWQDVEPVNLGRWW